VMELVEGEPLSAVLARERQLDVPRTLGIVRQTAAALAAAHAEGVVHRDIKPGNVLVTPDGHVKITDFGIAWSASSVPLTGTGQVLGTVHYLSPEQAQGGKASPASDVYALGAMAYECLAGRRPIDGENSVQIAVRQIREDPAPLPPDIPPAVRQVVERAMAKDPAQRYPDGAALRDAVDALGAGHSTAPVGPLHATTPLATVPAARLPAGEGSRTAVLPVPPMGTPPQAEPGPAAGRSRGVPRALAALLLGALVVVLLVVAGVAVLRGADSTSGGASAPSTSSSAPTTAPSTSAPAQPETVTVVAGDYVGRPVDEVQADLAGLGLHVQPKSVVTADGDEGTVVAVDPAGQVPIGEVVTVSYAVAPSQVSEDGNGNNGNGKGKDHGPGRGNGKKKKDD
jgi:eukaryotic-like serine/threonine-protein kinase